MLIPQLLYAAQDPWTAPPGSMLAKQVAFWIDIYTRYPSNQGVIHDSKYIDKIYEVINNPSIALSRKRYWKQVLLSLHQKESTLSSSAMPEGLTADEKKVWELFSDIQEPAKFLNAANRKRLRFQQGQKDQFQKGIQIASSYLPKIEEIFRQQGLPIELTRLPFVESSFNVKARSKVGASGIWQFMPATGRLYLRIDDAVDERNDPIFASEAAAQLLRANFESLGTWPLAVTAYNHGRKRIMRAIRQVGSTDLEDLIVQYKNRVFGFASRNFYSCLLAAIHIYKNAHHYFGALSPIPTKPTFEVALPEPIHLPKVSELMSLDLQVIAELNPALLPDTLQGRRLLPAGYRLRLPMTSPSLGPESSARVFLAGLESIPPVVKSGYTNAGDSGKGRLGKRRKPKNR